MARVYGSTPWSVYKRPLSMFLSSGCECCLHSFQVPLPIERYPGRMMKYGVISTARLKKVLLRVRAYIDVM